MKKGANGWSSMRKIDDLMTRAISRKVFPGAVLLASVGGDIRFFKAFGVADIFSRRPVSNFTFFDLASLTKPLATTLGIMALIKKEGFDIDQDIRFILPGFKISGITSRNLLAHTSGLPAWRPYYFKLGKMPRSKRKEALVGLILDESLSQKPDKGVLYSDIGFMILSRVIEIVSGKRLDRFLHETVYAPLEIDGLFFVDVHSKPAVKNFAATEICPWRKTMLEGVVHDDNAYASGGIEGHSGLFGNAEKVHKLLWEILSVFSGRKKSVVFEKKRLQIFFERERRGGRALGFDMPSQTGASCGKYFSKKSVGHLGFTGTSFWMDLEREAIAILLTNRVHPFRENEKIKRFRPVIHDAVMEAMIE